MADKLRPLDNISERKKWAQELKALSNNVREMTSCLSTFKKSVEIIGSEKDTTTLRSKLKTSRERLQSMARQNSTGVKELSSASSTLSATDRATHAQIVREFHSVIKEFQRAQRVCIEREAMYTAKLPARQDEVLFASFWLLPWDVLSIHATRSGEFVRDATRLDQLTFERSVHHVEAFTTGESVLSFGDPKN